MKYGKLRNSGSVSVLKSKQICPKPISRDLWCYDEVKNHWDQIKIISYQMINGEEAIYQEGTLGDILPVETILEEMNSRIGDVDKSIIFSGTVPLVDGFKYSNTFRCEMVDEILERKLKLQYDIDTISEEEK